MKPEKRKVLATHLAQGWIFTLLAFLVVGFFPRIELTAYDTLLNNYRYLQRQFYWVNEYFYRYKGYTGLHRSITLVGDQGVSTADYEKAHLEALRQYRLELAAAATWITEGEVHIPADLHNQPLEGTLVFALPTQIHQKVKASEQPPFMLKSDDPDGVIRELYLALKIEGGNLVPCLPLVLYSRFLSLDECDPKISGSMLTLGGRRIPVNEDEIGYSLPFIPYESAVRAHRKMTDSEFSLSDPLHPLSLAEVLSHPQWYFTDKQVHGRFYFLGNYSFDTAGERLTPTGPFRDFQLAAMGLDTLIQGPQVRWVSGWPRWLSYFAISSFLALWLLSPSSLFGRFVRLTELLIAGYTLGLGLLVAGYYLPVAWLNFYACFLTAWIVGRIWLTTLGYLRRYGGSTAARMLEMGQTHLDHSVAEERVATIVFVGLPSHLRQQELEDDPKILEHRQIFSEQIASITHRFAGIVHDFQADYLMLGFGTDPGHPDPEHARNAFLAAQQLIALRTMLNNAWLPKLDQGARVQVSVNTGLVAVGWVGTSKFKRASAAIGDTTNVAARLLGTAKKLDVDMIVSQSAQELLQGQAHFEALPPVMLKGKTEAVAIYKLVSPT